MSWFVALGWLLGCVLTLRLRSLPSGVETQVQLTVVIPARNEEAHIGELVQLLRQDGIGDVLVVDDSSTDGTADIARRAGAEVLSVDPPPAGWNGKSWACWSGVRHTDNRDGILVFLDADVEPAPGFVRRLAAAASSTDGLVSVEPWHRIQRPYERASAFVQLVTIVGAGTGSSGRGANWWHRSLAFGPALAIPRTAYERIGGHSAVRADIAEDVALAKVARRHDVKVSAWLGANQIAFRMYPLGPKQLIEGWTKNLTAGAGAVPPVRMLACVWWIAAAIESSVVATLHPSTSSLLTYSAFVAQIAFGLRRIGGFGFLTAVVFPLPLLAFLALFARSFVQARLRGAVQWRGRFISTRPTSTP